jgi:hypothetical protein
MGFIGLVKHFILVFALASLITGCGSSGGIDDSGSNGSGDGTGGTTPPPAIVPAAVNVTAASDSINPGQSTQVFATVYDQSGAAIAGVPVIFTLNDPTLGFITSTGVTSASGVAPCTFTARNLAGTVEITATAESVSNLTPRRIVILDETSPGEIRMTATPISILVRGTSTVRAEVLDIEGNPVSNGTTVTFEVANALYGTILETATTNNGFATSTFEASDTPGGTRISARAGGVSGAVDIEILQAPAATIEFVSAVPQRIAIRQTGGLDSSVVQFIVRNTNGNPLEGINVFFRMNGPNGGEYIDPSGDGTPDQIDVSTNALGIAQVILHSGDVAGPVTLSATINPGTPMTTESSVVSIGGGVPSARRFSVAAEFLNLPGLGFNNRTTELTAYFADRFGNYNVLRGTTVSFATEIGLAALSSTTTIDEFGTATVTLRTQGSVQPNIVSPENVQPLPWEQELHSYLSTNYGFLTANHPRDGLCAVLVYAKGEEHFDDSNGNGSYDFGEAFLDTDDDPYLDYNDNGIYDAGGSSDPQEVYVDSTGSGVWNGPNLQWDGNKNIFGNYHILITGGPQILPDTSIFSVADGGSQTIKVIVCDRNLNPLSPGSTISIESDAGGFSGLDSYTFPNSNAIGPTRDGHLSLIEFPFTVFDNTPGDTTPAQPVTVKITVNWEGLEMVSIISGTID